MRMHGRARNLDRLSKENYEASQELAVACVSFVLLLCALIADIVFRIY